MYIRQRGIVSGPFEDDVLREMVRRGDIKLFDEASEDGVNWVQADTCEWFPTESRVRFAPAAVESAGVDDDPDVNPDAGGDAYELSAPQGDSPPSGHQEWYYQLLGTNQGPVPSSVIEQLIYGGQLDTLSLVWHDGLDNWMPAGTTPELAPIFVRMGTGMQGMPQIAQPTAEFLVNVEPAGSHHAGGDGNRTMFGWYSVAFSKYAEFDGRSRRSEYWYFSLVNILIYLAFQMLLIMTFPSFALPMILAMMYLVYAVVAFIPSLAVLFRRLHDTGRSGWWWLILLIPLVGTIILLIFLVEDSQRGSNLYGPNPKTG